MSSSQEKQTKSLRARVEAEAEVKAGVDNNPSFSFEPEFLENRNDQFEHHTARFSNNSATNPAFDDNTENEDEITAKQVMDVFMEVQREERERGERNQERVQRNQEHVQRIFLLFIFLLFFVILLLLLILLRWERYAGYRY
ncbi:uncharacterized protein LY89DRAFT_744092 [Mollisia scopiformis]|uniref:Uncharacterized protein n=1 Tax=Mollisia scopiformis TaxID=149040 RepID=A0A132B1F8_MOLSC|nr:uncharacterized protein LY89DRAFT_744092 [Mollisia scopiformis]KUJ06141.1 hypothetical protein LY89DRAFT_744092 [Mollisia scopiformis]